MCPQTTCMSAFKLLSPPSFPMDIHTLIHTHSHAAGTMNAPLVQLTQKDHGLQFGAIPFGCVDLT